MTITIKKLNQVRLACLKRVEKFTETETMKYSKLAHAYLDANCPLEKDKVYELQPAPGTNPKRRRYTRFVVYKRDLAWIGKKDAEALIRVGGWWLDQNNIPAKWDTRVVGGAVGNPDVFILSKNQKARPHPNATKSSTKKTAKK
jgi:hypothetical protein